MILGGDLNLIVNRGEIWGSSTWDDGTVVFFSDKFKSLGWVDVGPLELITLWSNNWWGRMELLKGYIIYWSMGQCKKMRDLLDVIVVFKNTIMLPKNTTRFCYIALSMVQPEPYMSWDMYDWKPYCVRVIKLQNTYVICSSKTCTWFSKLKLIYIDSPKTRNLFYPSRTRNR